VVLFGNDGRRYPVLVVDTMIREFRLALYFIVGVLLSAVSMFSYADVIPATQGTEQIETWYHVGNQACAQGSLRTTAAAACSSELPWLGWIYDSVSGSTCMGHTSGDSTVRVAASVVTQYKCPSEACPSNTTHVCTTSVYTCPSGYTGPDASNMCTSGCGAGSHMSPAYINEPAHCVADEECVAGQKVSSEFSGTGSSSPATLCNTSGCVITTGFCGSGGADGSSGKWWCSGGVMTGAKCSGSPDVPAAPPVLPDSPEGKCISQGQSWGTVNGVTVCVPPDKIKDVTKTTETPPAGGSPPKTVDVTNVTSCTGAGSCTTTTTTTTTSGGSGPGGTGPGSTTSTETKVTEGSKASMCEATPNSAMCKGVSECDEHPEQISCMDAGDPGEEGPVENKATTVNSIVPTVLAVDMSCPQPITLPHNWGVVSWSLACDMAGMIRPVVLAFAWLAAGILLIGAVKT